MLYWVKSERMKVIADSILAMLTMLIDHIGLIWFPENMAWRIIGRLALPFYAFAIVLGYYPNEQHSSLSEEGSMDRDSVAAALSICFSSA